MTQKLASAIVCIGIAVGSLSAPKSSKSGTQPGHAVSPTSQQLVVQSDGKVDSLGSVNAPLGAVASSLAFDVGTVQPGHPGTNSFGVTLQQ
jgi:hypothetical protein